MALPEQMNFTQHIDSMGIKKDRIGLAPNNGSSFICNTGYLNFEVPCQQFSKFADFANAYIAFDITNSGKTQLFQFYGLVNHLGYAGAKTRRIENVQTYPSEKWRPRLSICEVRVVRGK